MTPVDEGVLLSSQALKTPHTQRERIKKPKEIF
jgi:hypothetical protein